MAEAFFINGTNSGRVIPVTKTSHFLKLLFLSKN
jgi:hypothetical protein